jgi:hypothetical protein
METTKTIESKKDSRRQYPNLDKRYGKIGIPAVAAALHYQDEPHNENETDTIPDQHARSHPSKR